MKTETRLPAFGEDAVELRRLRIQNRLELERAKAKRIEHLKRVQEVRQTNEWAMAHAPAVGARTKSLMESTFQADYVSAYADWLDRFRNNEVSLFQISSPTDRRLGSFFPFFRNENELSLLRMPSRIVATTNNYAIGMLGGLSSFVVADGFSYSCKAKRKQCPQELVDYCQDVIEAYQARNQWHGGEQPGMEEDAFARSETDGEFLLFNEADDDGCAWTYTVEPEQLVQPPHESIEEWSFGIMANPANPQVHEAYWIRGSNVPDGREYSTDEIVHFRANVPRSVKRGLPSFSFSTYDTFNIADKLRRGVGLGAAIQSCIAWVRKHSAASSSQVDAFQQQIAQFETVNQVTGAAEKTQKFSPGEILDVDENQEYIPPPSAANGQAHVSILQMLLRGASTRWNAPEWISSADASNNNFASSLVAESPFVRRVQGRQRGIGEAFRRCHEFALKTHFEHRGQVTIRVKEGERATEKTFTWKDVLRLVEIQVEGVSPVVTDKASEAQRFSTEHQAGVLSVKTWQMQAGYDPDTEEANNREWEEAHAPQPGAGLEAMFGGGGPKPGMTTMESLLEAKDASGHEHGSDGKFTGSGGGGGQGGKESPNHAAGKLSPMATIHDAIQKSTGNLRGWLKRAKKSGEDHKEWAARADEHIGEALAKIDHGMRKEFRDFKAAITSAYGSTPKTRELIANAQKVMRRHRDQIQTELDDAKRAFAEGDSKAIADISGHASKAMFAMHRDVTGLYQQAWKALQDEPKRKRVLESSSLEAIVGRRLLEAKDASGHEHGKDGKFTGSGGSGSGSSKDAGPKAKAVSQKPSPEVVDNNISIFGNNVRKALASVKAGKMSRQEAKARIAANAAKATEAVSKSFDREWGTFKRKIETHFAESEIRAEILRDFRDTLKAIRAKVTSKIDDIHWATDGGSQKTIDRAIETARIAADGMNEDLTEAYKEAAAKLKHAPRKLSESLDEFEIIALLESEEGGDVDPEPKKLGNMQGWRC